jgi:hypothetical protein
MAPKLSSPMQCDQAGAWKQDCRHFWVENQLWNTDTPKDLLLKVCGNNQDCILDVLDVRHSKDVYQQLIQCEQWAGTNQRHCASHAMQRWRYVNKSSQDFFGLLKLQNPFAEEIGYWLAVTQFCDKTGECSGKGDAYQICIDYVVDLRQTVIACPQNRMHPNKPKHY